jgi:hypothetical protein
MLVNSVKSPERLSRTLPLMVKNLFSIGPYPLLVYHTSNYSVHHLTKLAQIVHLNQVHFELVDFPNTARHGVVPKRGRHGKCALHDFSMGYRNMCFFHASGIYDTALLRNSDVEYVWRIDDDSGYTAPAPDLFKVMQNGNYLYAYAQVKSPDICVEGLWEFTKAFAQRQNLSLSWKRGTIFYNNFEIVAMELVRSQRYIKYLTEIDRDGGIFRFRWGDAPIKTLAAQLFVPPERLLGLPKSFRGQIYCHPLRSTACTKRNLERPLINWTRN